MEQENEQNTTLVELLRELRSLHACQSKLREELVGHMAREENRLDELVSAFPGGDARGHREYHEALISATQQRVRLREAIIEKSLSALIWLGLVWIGYSLWQAFRHALGLG